MSLEELAARESGVADVETWCQLCGANVTPTPRPAYCVWCAEAMDDLVKMGEADRARGREE